jgi:hypothetical protein
MSDRFVNPIFRVERRDPVEQAETNLADESYRRDLMGGAASDDPDWYGPDDFDRWDDGRPDDGDGGDPAEYGADSYEDHSAYEP